MPVSAAPPDSQMTLVDDGAPRTPRGALVLVFDTPEPEGDMMEDIPVATDDEDDAAPLAQANQAHNVAQAMGAPLVQLPQPVHQNVPQVAPLNQHDLNAVMVEQAQHGGNVMNAQLAHDIHGNVMGAERELNDGGQVYSPGWSSSLPPSSPIDSFSTSPHSAQPPPGIVFRSSSPIDVDFSSSTARAGDRGEQVRADESREARTMRAPHAGIDGGQHSIQGNLIPTEQRSASSRSQTADSAELYWRHVDTPRASQLPATLAGSGMTPQEAYRGKLHADSTHENNPPNARKRCWAGSPNLEDTLRRLGRPRLEGTTPALRNATPLPNTPYADSNPWNNVEGRRGGLAGVGRIFAPVASSTPQLSAVHDSIDETPQYRANESGHPPTPHGNSDTPSPAARAEARSRGNRVAGLAHAASRQNSCSMDVDDEGPADSDDDAMDRARRAKGKGKGRAVPEPEPEDASDNGGTELGREEGWDEAQLLEARQRSLRQVLEDRAGPRRDEHGMLRADEDQRGTWTGAQMWTEHDVAGPSGAGGRGEDPNTVYDHETCEYQFRENEQAHGGRETPRVRARSEYRPLPNTRAAEFLRNREPRRGDSYGDVLPQRSPLSRISGMQRQQSLGRPYAPAPEQYERTGRYDFAEGSRSAQEARGHPSWEGSVDASRSRRQGDRMDWSGEEEDAEDYQADYEEGEILPTVMEEGVDQEDHPMEVPREGFPAVHRDDPEANLRGMAVDWVREMWSDPPNRTVYIDIYNYRYCEDDLYNRRISETLRARTTDISGEHDFDVVPPEAETASGARVRDMPTIWAIRRLSPEGVARLLSRRLWSFRSISFFTSPRSTTMPRWIFMMEGFLDGNLANIRAAVLRVLGEGEMRDWLARMIVANPEFRGRTPEEGVEWEMGTMW
ncbi:hypothetical protein C8T65DRAFT_744567 [Cerioporus squamosus]|nr:hypothetical protein C8T65DRAFT_744567 [Cerioporus squamosus]